MENQKYGATLFSAGKPSQVISLAKDKDRHSEKFGAKPFAQDELAREVKRQIELWRAEARLAFIEQRYQDQRTLYAGVERLRMLYHDIL